MKQEINYFEKLRKKALSTQKKKIRAEKEMRQHSGCPSAQLRATVCSFHSPQHEMQDQQLIVDSDL